MSFNEELAAKLAAQHNLPEATVKTWRFRGQIPDKYFTGDTSPKLSPDEPRIQRLMRLLGLPTIQPAKFSMGEKFHTQAKTGDRAWTEKLATDCEAEFREIQAKAATASKISDATRMGRIIMAEKRIHPFNIFGAHLFDRIRGKVKDATPQEVREMQTKISQFGKNLD